MCKSSTFASAFSSTTSLLESFKQKTRVRQLARRRNSRAFRPGAGKALFIWSRVPETTLPLETTLRSVYMELRVVTAVPSSTLVSLETAKQVTYWTKWRAP